MSGDMKLVEVLGDLVQWPEKVEGTVPAQYLYHRAEKGARVEVPAFDAKRLSDLGLVVEVTSEDDVEAAREGYALDQGPAPAGHEGDDALAALNAAELVAYLTSYPAEQERVLTLEKARTDGGRKTVLKAAGVPETEGA